jgi:hypothetical protein
LDAGGLEAAVAGYEGQRELKGSCGDDAIGHVGNDASRNLLNSVCNEGIHRGDEQS